jgi:hypothetical protein
MIDSHPRIYHLVTESDFRSQLEGGLYIPSSLNSVGFVHCALEASVIQWRIATSRARRGRCCSWRSIRHLLETESTIDRTYTIALVDAHGTLHAEVDKVIQIRRREPASSPVRAR